ncbi:MAG: DUF192 domain-containing protein [Acidobacteriota bacterium]
MRRRARGMQVPAVVVSLMALVACTPAATVESPRPARPVGQVTFPSGRGFFVDLAITPAEQARGYMGRSEIRDDEGILFHGDGPRVRRFWMKNCLVPIDMIWLDQDYRVLFIEHSAPPCREDPCPGFGPLFPTTHVLEVKGGIAAAEKLAVGERLRVVTDPIPPAGPAPGSPY